MGDNMTIVNEVRFKVVDRYQPTKKLSFKEFMVKVHEQACKMRSNSISEEIIDRRIKKLIASY